MNDAAARQILDEVARRPARDGIRIIGVDGCSGSGKSTLAKHLAAYSGAPIVEIDDFVSWDDFAGWWPRFDEQVLSPLLAGQDARYQVRDWEHDWRGGSLAAASKTTEWQPLVIFEGVTCTRLEATGRITYAAWTEAPAAVRLSRGLSRDAATRRSDVEELWTRWMVEEEEFFRLDGTRERADLVLPTAT